MEMSQNDVDALLNANRVEEVAIAKDSPSSGPLEPLKTFRGFISNSRKKVGAHYARLQSKEAQLIKLHKQTVDNIKLTRRINKEAIDFFEQRRRDYDSMVDLVLNTSRAGRIVPVPSYGSLALR
jgi:hypothetical protein